MRGVKDHYDCQIKEVWYKKCPIGKNTLAKFMKTIASTAEITGKFSNSSGSKTAIQSLRGEFHPLEISELTGHANVDSISSYSHNPLERQRQMSHRLSGYTTSTTNSSTTINDQNVSTDIAVIVPAATDVVDSAAIHGDRQDVRKSGFLAGTIGSLFKDVHFSHSPVNISINLQSLVNNAAG